MSANREVTIKSEPAVPAAIYARYSTDKQDGRSIEDQLRRCRGYATERDFKVVREFSDAAVSGGHLERPEFQRMLAEAKGRGRPFRRLIVDDLSRLSRDLGDMWAVVFTELASAGVVVDDATTRMASDSPGARMMFGAVGLANDFQRQAVRSQTHRGLEGRALGGFWTGGRVYGYETEREPNPADPAHPRMVQRINEAEAVVVRRIFGMYAEGRGFKRIASALNAEGVTSPYGGTRWGERRRGWASSSVRSVLMNERYAGRFVWNRNKWIRVGPQRLRRERPESEWRVREAPELAIIEPDIWAAVQTALGEARKRAGRPSGSGRTAYLLSGLLRCGTCRGSMSVVGGARRDGKRWVKFGCSAHANKGAAICPNNLTISERKATRGRIAALRGKLEGPVFAEEMVAGFREGMAASASASSREREPGEVRREIAAVEARVRNLAEAVASHGLSPALSERLSSEEADLRRLRSVRASRGTSDVSRGRLREAAEVEGYFRDFSTSLDAEPEVAGPMLRRHMGEIVMTPTYDGPRRFYVGSGPFDVSAALLGDAGKVVGKDGCGGRI